MGFRAIIKINHEQCDGGKARTYRLPSAPEAIGDTIAGHFGSNAIQKQFIHLWQQDADGRHLCAGVEIVVGRTGRYPTFPTSCEWANVDGGFRIDRNA